MLLGKERPGFLDKRKDAVAVAEIAKGRTGAGRRSGLPELLLARRGAPCRVQRPLCGTRGAEWGGVGSAEQFLASWWEPPKVQPWGPAPQLHVQIKSAPACDGTETPALTRLAFGFHVAHSLLPSMDSFSSSENRK